MTMPLPELPLLDVLQTGIILLDKEGRVLHWNQWFQQHLGADTGPINGRTPAELFPELQGTRLEACIDQALRFRLSSMLTPGLNRPVLPLYQKPSDRKQGRRMQQLIQVSALLHPEVACLIQIQDMTSTVRRERRLRVQSTQLLDASYRDQLTGIGNRRRFDHAFHELFAKAQAAASSLSLLMIDVDFFKAYNDLYGHQRGDECLRLVAQGLQQGLRQDTGDLICRYGGEEFAVLLPGTDETTAIAVSERLRQRVEALKLLHEDSQVSRYLSISLGLAALTPNQGQPSHILVTGADMALYHAKEEGRNRCMYYSLRSHEILACP